MDDGFQFDATEFSRALAFVEQASGKDAAFLLNKAALSVIIGGRGFQGALQLTKKADAARIRGNLHIEKAVRIVKSRAARAGKTLTTAEAVRSARKMITSAVRASGYTRGPGWHKAIQAFGGRGVRVQSGFQQSHAAAGSGSKASTARLVAEIINTAPAAEQIGQQPLQRAITNVSRDLVEYGERKLNETFRRVNA